MELHNLKVTPGSQHSSKRVGRGLGSGMGKTSTRGQKGQGARSGGSVGLGFEGGQLPLYRRFPKRGFRSLNTKEYQEVDVTSLNRFAELKVTDITEEVLLAFGLIKNDKSNKKLGVKIIGNGEVTSKFNVTVTKITKGARSSIEKAGGKVTLLGEEVSE